VIQLGVDDEALVARISRGSTCWHTVGEVFTDVTPATAAERKWREKCGHPTSNAVQMINEESLRNR